MNVAVERSLEDAKPFVRGFVAKGEEFAGDSNSGSESSASGGSCADSGDSSSASPSGFGPMPEPASRIAK